MPPIPTVNRLLNIGLEGRRGACFNSPMSTTLIEVRRAKAADASAIASTHDEAWRAAYQGIIPGPELDKLINRRGANWWDSAIRKGSRISILGFGHKLFASVRRDLTQSGLQSMVVWALSDNAPALEFYRSLGGKAVARSS